MTKYKLVALDMDGTLLNEQSEVSSENAEWVQKALDAGVTVCLSTGRDFESAVPYAEQLKLDTPMITMNGSEIWHRPYVLYKRTELKSTYIKQLHELALKHSEAWYWAYSTNSIFTKDKWLNSMEDYDSFQWLKFGYDIEDDQIREQLLGEIKSLGALEITNSSTTNIELNPIGISKASGIRELCGLMDIDMSQVVAVGDSLNDVAAIREAGLGVAMGNAQEIVKEAADEVTLTNDEHGVAEIIRRFVLNG